MSLGAPRRIGPGNRPGPDARDSQEWDGAQDRQGAAIQGALGLPWAARLASILAIGCGVQSVVCLVPRLAFASLLGSRLSELPPAWVGRWVLSWFGLRCALAMLGVLGVLGGVALLCRQEWGRRLIVAFAFLLAVLLIADWPLACSMSLGLGASVFREYWDVIIGLAAIALHAAFLSTYMCSRQVRNAMRRRTCV